MNFRNLSRGCLVTTLALLLSAGTVCRADGMLEWARLGNEALSRGDDMEAMKYYKMCLGGPNGSGETLRAGGSTLFSIALIYQSCGDPDEALKYVLKSIELGKALEYTNILAPRYELASEIYLQQGNAAEALEAACIGLSYAKKTGNPNIIARLQMKKADAVVATGGDRDVADSLYLDSVQRLLLAGKGHVRHQEACYKLGLNAEAAGDTLKAKEYYMQMLQGSSWGTEPVRTFSGATRLATLETDPVLVERYRSIADSMAWAPEFEKLENGLALSGIEFPRKERDAEISARRQQAVYLMVIALMAILSAMAMTLMFRSSRRQARELEAANADLIRVNLQKDRLLEIAQKAAEDRQEVESISRDVVSMPVVKLSKRELEVAVLAGKGMLNKEIGEQLGISHYTVGVHKNNIYRKLGISNNVELLRYLQKAGHLEM